MISEQHTSVGMLSSRSHWIFHATLYDTHYPSIRPTTCKESFGIVHETDLSWNRIRTYSSMHVNIQSAFGYLLSRPTNDTRIGAKL